MIEMGKEVDGVTAYAIALKNLEITWSYPDILNQEYSDRYFHYGEEGRALVLPGELVYVSTTTDESIKKIVGGKIVFDTGLKMVTSKFEGIGGAIPSKSISEVLAFTDDLKKRMENGIFRWVMARADAGKRDPEGN